MQHNLGHLIRQCMTTLSAILVRHSRAILRCPKMQGRNAVQYDQALVAKKPEPSAAQGLRDSKIPQACPAGFLCFKATHKFLKILANDPPLSCNGLFVAYSSGTPRSRQILRAKKSLISRCLGTALVWSLFGLK